MGDVRSEKLTSKISEETAAENWDGLLLAETDILRDFTTYRKRINRGCRRDTLDSSS